MIKNDSRGNFEGDFDIEKAKHIKIKLLPAFSPFHPTNQKVLVLIFRLTLPDKFSISMYGHSRSLTSWYNLWTGKLKYFAACLIESNLVSILPLPSKLTFPLSDVLFPKAL